MKKIHRFAPFCLALASSVSFAQSGGNWDVSGSLYLFLPEIESNSASYPTVRGTHDAGSSPGLRDIQITGDEVLDSLQSTFMGMIDAHNGQWGVLLDLVYFDLEASKNTARSGVSNLTGDFDVGFKGTAVTLVGQYRVANASDHKVDLLGGVRMFDIKASLDWNITGGGGALPPTGSSKLTQTLWDAIIGVKGRVSFGDNNAWSIPYYLDIGTGESKRTAQAYTGLSYAFKWGSVDAAWRWVDYELDGDSRVESVTFNGPMVGATFKF